MHYVLNAKISTFKFMSKTIEEQAKEFNNALASNLVPSNDTMNAVRLAHKMVEEALKERERITTVEIMDRDADEVSREWLAHHVKIAREEERSRWVPPLLDDAISITVEARSLGKVLITRKFTSITEAHQSGNRLPHLLAEEAVNEITKSLEE
jgi:hypothetical protein